jgi:hypothetical protein
MDEKGDPWADGSPQMIVGGQEDIEIILVTSSDDRGLASAKPETWPRDTSWASMAGISAMLTMDNDSMAKVKGTADVGIVSGATSISATFSVANLATSIPLVGNVNIFAANGTYESIAYSSREIVGNKVTFALDGSVTGTYPATTTVVDCKEAPLAEAFLDAEKSDFSGGKLCFTFNVDSYHLRAVADYSNTANIAIGGVELLFYAVGQGGAIQKKRAYLWRTVALRNTMGNPGFEAELPDAYHDYITSAVKNEIKNITPNAIGATPLMNILDSFEGGHQELYCEPGNYYWIHDVQILMVNITDPTSMIESVILVELSTEDDGGGSIDFPLSLKWVGEPEFEPGKTYLISIINNIAVAAEVTV